jgi:hypothetical protein
MHCLADKENRKGDGSLPLAAWRQICPHDTG